MKRIKRQYVSCELCGKKNFYSYTRGFICNRCKRELKNREKKQ